MTDDDLRAWAEAHLAVSKNPNGVLAEHCVTVLRLLGEKAALRFELEGANKACAMLNAGMGRVCEGRDELKMENRRLADENAAHLAINARLVREVQELKAKLVSANEELGAFRIVTDGLTRCVHAQGELLSQKAEVRA